MHDHMVDFSFSKPPYKDEWTIKIVVDKGAYANHIFKAIQDCFFKKVKV